MFSFIYSSLAITIIIITIIITTLAFSAPYLKVGRSRRRDRPQFAPQNDIY